MRPILVLALLGWLGSCQPKQPTAARSAAASPSPPPPPSRYQATLPVPPPTPAALPDSALTRFLRQYAVAPLLQSVRSEQETIPYNGFFGPERHRIEVVFLRVRPDAAQPRRLLVAGRSRFKGRIRELQGTIELTGIRPQPALNKAELAYEAEQEAMRMVTIVRLPGAPRAERYYTLTGRFAWQEPATDGGGQFTGQAVLDVAVTDQHGLQSVSLRQTDGARGAALLFDGEWTSYRTAHTKPFILVENVGGFAEHVLEEFEVGERDVVINPKYAKLGWDSYWENDEWWAEPVKVPARKPASASIGVGAPTDTSAGL
ncbi:hypothetical protein [Hymenobacter rigui]|uniref:Uncharacterized protein n=1 Tax=Hymenobacter rigui TaxID=334424 RepID=A0A428KEZ6_9BACT|nr:hypothetical protein [Hymenobacter rigui]RSK45057.1 hypothetical protein EI291_19665 [Hymenobacter rigui]